MHERDSNTRPRGGQLNGTIVRAAMLRLQRIRQLSRRSGGIIAIKNRSDDRDSMRACSKNIGRERARDTADRKHRNGRPATDLGKLFQSNGRSELPLRGRVEDWAEQHIVCAFPIRFLDFRKRMCRDPDQTIGAGQPANS